MARRLVLREDQENADWLRRQAWDLPPYKSRAFFLALGLSGISLTHFRTLPVYLGAVARGQIVKDEWRG